MNDICAVIFDLDGTLVDTEGVAARVVQKYLEKHGISGAKREAESIVGRTWRDCAAILRDRFGFPEPVEKITETLIENYDEETRAGFVEVEGASLAVRTLARTYPLALVSGSTRADIERALRELGIEECFQFWLGAEDYRAGKPSPEGFQMAISRLGVAPQSVVIFEDSAPGIAAGRASGARVVAIECTNRYHQDQSQAEFRIRDWNGMSAELLARLIFSDISKGGA